MARSSIMTAVAVLILVGDAAAAEYFEGFGFYLGELHSHTGASGDGGSSDLGHCDGECGSALDVAGQAATYGLDFITYTDHLNGGPVSTPELFEEAQEAIRDAHDPDGGLVTLPAGELFITVGEHSDGHKNLYFFADNEDLADLTFEEMRFNADLGFLDHCDDIWAFVEQLQDRFGPVLLIPHHPGLSAEMGTDWTCHQGEDARYYSPAVEIYSEHGDSSFGDTDFDTLWMGVDDLKTVEAALDPEIHGLRLGFLGGTDQHDTHPGSLCSTDTVMPHHPYGGGLTVAVLPESDAFDRDTLYQAIRHRQTYATSGPLIPAVVEYWGDGEYLGGMGEDLDLSEVQALAVELRVPEAWDSFVTEVSLIGPEGDLPMDASGGGLFEASATVSDLPIYLYPLLKVDGEAWYGDDGCDDGGDSGEERIWLSPTWFEPHPDGPLPDDDDDDDNDDDDDDDVTADDDSAGDDDTSGDDDTTGDPDDDNVGNGFLTDPEAPGSCSCVVAVGPATGAGCALAVSLVALLARRRSGARTS